MDKEVINFTDLESLKEYLEMHLDEYGEERFPITKMRFAKPDELREKVPELVLLVELDPSVFVFFATYNCHLRTVEDKITFAGKNLSIRVMSPKFYPPFDSIESYLEDEKKETEMEKLNRENEELKKQNLFVSHFIPEWSLDYLMTGNKEGLTLDQIYMIKKYMKQNDVLRVERIDGRTSPDFMLEPEFGPAAVCATVVFKRKD